MADKPPTPQEDLIKKITAIINTPVDDLIQNSQADQQKGVLIFNEIKPKIEELIGYLTELNLENLTDLPKSRFNILHSKLSPIIAEITKIQKTEKNPNLTDTAQKQASINFFNNTNNQGYYEKEKENIWKLILETITLENRKSQDSNLSKTKLKEIEIALKSAKESENKINDILSSSRTELAKGGVSKHSDIFGNQAEIHKTSADNWRKNAIGLLIGNALLVIIILVLVIWVVADKTLRIEVGIFGAVLVSLVSYAIVLCVKNFFAEKHNQNVNQHRANCLGTYNTFIDSADEERKAAVLLQATNTIFSHQKSGYLTKDTETNNPNPIVEIVRKITTGKGE